MVARTFISDQPDWINGPSANWVGMGINTSDSFEPALTAAENVNDILNTAPSDLGGPITIGITQAELVKLREDFMVIKSFADAIHYEVAELIDVPFAQKLEPVVQQSYDLSPENFRTEKNILFVPRGKSLQELISGVIEDDALKKDFESKVKSLNDDEVRQDLKDVMDDARFWAEEFEKAEVISAIQRKFIEDHAAEWDNLSRDERIELIEEYAIAVGRALDEKHFYDFFRGDPIARDVIWGLEDPGYTPNLADSWGWTYPSRRDGLIYINDNFATGNPPNNDLNMLLNTVTHETRHQYQNQVVHDTGRFDTPSSLVGRFDRDNAINTNERYWRRPVEIDARGFAALCSFN